MEKLGEIFVKIPKNGGFEVKIAKESGLEAGKVVNLAISFEKSGK